MVDGATQFLSLIELITAFAKRQLYQPPFSFRVIFNFALSTFKLFFYSIGFKRKKKSQKINSGRQAKLPLTSEVSLLMKVIKWAVSDAIMQPMINI